MKKIVLIGSVALVFLSVFSCSKQQVKTPAIDQSKPTNWSVKSQGINYIPSSFDEIGSLYGSIHNSILDYVLYEQSVDNHAEIQPSIISFFNENAMPQYNIDNSSYFNTLIPEIIDNKAEFHAYLDELKTVTQYNSLLTFFEKSKFDDYFAIAHIFIEDGNLANFMQELNSIKSQLLTHTAEATLTNATQETVRLLAVIGIAEFSGIYWEEKRNQGEINVDSYPDPAGIAPWVLLDAGGAAIAAVTSAGNYAVSGGGSWGGFGWDVLAGAGYASCGASLAKWLKW